MFKRTKSFSKQAKKLLKSKKGFFVDTGVKVLIAVVLGSLILGGTYALANDTIMPTVKTKVESMFDYSGSNNVATPIIDEEKYSVFACMDVLKMDDEYNCGGESVADGPAEKFIGIEIDGNPIDSTGYSVRINKFAYITLNKTTFDKIECGNHTMKFIYQDGYALGKFNMLSL